MQRYAFPLKPPNYLPKNFFLNKSLINRDLLGNALRKGSRSLSICIPTSLTVAPAPFFVLLMFLLLFSISAIFYWFSIYSQEVALLDAALLRVLAWSSILLAGLAQSLLSRFFPSWSLPRPLLALVSCRIPSYLSKFKFLVP